MEDFFFSHPNAGAGEEPRKQAIEAVRTNIFWIEEREQELVESYVPPL